MATGRGEVYNLLHSDSEGHALKPASFRYVKAETLEQAIDALTEHGDEAKVLAGAKLAQALVHGPKLIILDEPTNGLDPPTRQRMIELIRAIRDSDSAPPGRTSPAYSDPWYWDRRPGS